jgi:hypothetical protein
MRPIVIFILVVREAVHVAYRKLDQAALMLRDFDAEEQEGQKYIWCKFGTKQVQGPVRSIIPTQLSSPKLRWMSHHLARE